MKFRKWIKRRGGPNEVATLVGTNAAVVRAWLRAEASPRVLMLQKLVRLGRGAFSFNDVINETNRLTESGDAKDERRT